MKNKKGEIAVLIDTNIIISEKNRLHIICEELSKKFKVYVAEVSISERIGQIKREVSGIYDRMHKAKREYKKYFDIREKETFEKCFEVEKKDIRENYLKHFKDMIIPLKIDTEMFENVLERSCVKTPPFNSNPSSSDKGFKDSLIWLSAIEFFKSTPDISKVIFITGDKGFSSQDNTLIDEFKTETGIDIEFKGKSFIKEIMGEEFEEKSMVEPKEKELTCVEKQQLRKNISDVFFNIMNVQIDDQWGEYYEETYNLIKKFSLEDIKDLFANLRNIIDVHLFDESIQASEFFGQYSTNINDKHKIPLDAIDKLYELYKNIEKHYPDYLEQFFITACDKLNSNAYIQSDDDDDELPF